jgi:subtilisin family serine protease
MMLRLLIAILASFSFGVMAEAAPAPEFNPGRILVIPKDGKTADTDKIHKQKSRRVLKKFPAFKNLEVIDLPAGQNVLDAIKEYVDSGLVEIAEPDYLVHASATPDDPYFLDGSQWHLSGVSTPLLDADINAPEGWEIRHDAANIIVAIIDGGIRVTHEDLAPNLWTNAKETPGNGLDDDGDGYIDDVHGINTIDGSGNVDDTDGHGTHVAGIIGAVGNNGLGTSGVAWKVQLMPLKFLNTNNIGFTSSIVECINYAIKHGADVINASFGSQDPSSILQTAISSARSAGIVVVAAAGNEKANNDLIPSYPASFTLDNIISVCATSSLDVFDSVYSNFGPISVDIAAPGTRIYSCGIGSDTNYVFKSGTSMATPVVSGIVALVKAQFPNETPSQIRQRLIATADSRPSLIGKCVSGGKVNLLRALSSYVSAAFASSTTAGAFPLTVQFTNQSIGDIAGFHWDFGDGATSTDTNVTHVFTSDGNYTVTLTVTGTNGATSIATRLISAEPSYTFASVPYQWIDPTAMTPFTLADNGVTGAQDLPFSFSFFGTAQEQIYIGANGLLGFDSASMQTTSHTDIPNATSPNGTILPYWDNLNPASAGAVYAGVVGTAPNRRFVVSWVGVTRNTSSDQLTFQAVLSERTGEVQFNYQEVAPASTRGAGLQATIGLEDPAGVHATKYCYNGVPNKVANQQSILFSPNGKLSLRFRGVTMVNGNFGFEVPGAAGQRVLIESSSDLIQWHEEFNDVVGDTGRVQFTNTASTEAEKFFRARLLP